MTAAVRTRNVVVLDELFHLFIGPAFAGNLAFRPVFNQLVSSVSCLADLAIHQRIRESLQMTGCFPYLRIHQDRSLDFNVVRIFLDKLLLPCALDVVLQHDAVWTEIPCIAQAAVYFRALEYEPGFLCM